MHNQHTTYYMNHSIEVLGFKVEAFIEVMKGSRYVSSKSGAAFTNFLMISDVISVQAEDAAGKDIKVPKEFKKYIERQLIGQCFNK